jgi:hypothetical protein
MLANACAPHFERRWDALMVEGARVRVYRDAARRCPLRYQQAQRLFHPQVVQRERAQLEGEADNLRVNRQG